MQSNIVNMAFDQMRRGINPHIILNQLARNNPQVSQLMKLLDGKSEAELRQFAQNVAKERGVDLDEFMRSMGITIPSNR